MKQKVSFFETDSAKTLMGYSHQLIGHAFEAFLGGMWVGFLWLFVMFMWKLNSFYQKGVVEDKKEYKILYRDMNKKSRKIVGAFIIFVMITICLLCSIEQEFLRCVMKGLVLCAAVIPIMNGYYGDKKRFKFSF